MTHEKPLNEVERSESTEKDVSHEHSLSIKSFSRIPVVDFVSFTIVKLRVFPIVKTGLIVTSVPVL